MNFIAVYYFFSLLWTHLYPNSIETEVFLDRGMYILSLEFEVNFFTLLFSCPWPQTRLATIRKPKTLIFLRGKT
jgi:hypothetical protein